MTHSKSKTGLRKQGKETGGGLVVVSVARARAPASGFKFCWSQRKEPWAFLSAFPDVGQEQKKQGLKTCQQSNINNGVRAGYRQTSEMLQFSPRPLQYSTP